MFRLKKSRSLRDAATNLIHGNSQFILCNTLLRLYPVQKLFCIPCSECIIRLYVVAIQNCCATTCGVNACTVDSKVTVGALISIAKILACCRCRLQTRREMRRNRDERVFSKNNDQPRQVSQSLFALQRNDRDYYTILLK